jgi:hypothetical protein
VSGWLKGRKRTPLYRWNLMCSGSSATPKGNRATQNRLRDQSPLSLTPCDTERVSQGAGESDGIRSNPSAHPEVSLIRHSATIRLISASNKGFICDVSCKVYAM